MSSPHRFEAQDHYLSFNESGRSGHVRIEGLSLPPQKLTFALTFRSRADEGGDGGIFSYASQSNDNEFLVIGLSDGSHLYIGGGSGKRLKHHLFDDNAWQDLVVTWDGTTGRVHMFNNGVHLGASTAARAPLDGNGVLILGQDQDSFGGGFQANQALRGDIAKLTIWDRVLEADEIKDGPDTGDAVHHFAFDQGSGTTVQDQRGDLQARIIGDVTWKDESPPRPAVHVYDNAADTVGDEITGFDVEADVLDLSAIDGLVALSHGPTPHGLWTEQEGAYLRVRGDTDGDARSAEIDLKFSDFENFRPQNPPSHGMDPQDHYLSLNENSRSGHVRIEGLSLPPQKLTFALTFRSRADEGGDGGIFSYASQSNDNEFLVIGLSDGSYLYIGGGSGKRLKHHLFDDNAWQDLVVTWDGTTGRVHMFNNGVHLGASTAARAPLDGNGVLILGQDQDSFGGGFQANQALRGDIAKLTIWDRVLEADEIKDGPDTGDAVHHFAFDQGSGTTVQDQRSDLHARIIGDVTWKDETPLTSANVKLAGEVHNGILDVSDVSSGLSLDVGQLKDVTHVIGTAQADTLTGDGQGNQLEGHDGNDTLIGNDGNDVLVGGLGADTKTGGEGADTFVYRTAAETIGDIITDFNPDEDTLDFSAFGSSLTFSEEGPKAKSLWTEIRDDGLHLLGDTDGDTSSTEIDLTFRSLEALGSSPTGSGSVQSTSGAASGGPAVGSAPPEPIYVLQSPTVYRAPGDASSVGSSGSPAVLGGTNGGSSFGSSLDFSSLANQGFSSNSLSRGSVPDLSGFAGSHGHGLSSQAPDLSGVSSSSGNNIPDGMTGISAGDPTLDAPPREPVVINIGRQPDAPSGSGFEAHQTARIAALVEAAQNGGDLPAGFREVKPSDDFGVRTLNLESAAGTQMGLYMDERTHKVVLVPHEASGALQTLGTAGQSAFGLRPNDRSSVSYAAEAVLGTDPTEIAQAHHELTLDGASELGKFGVKTVLNLVHPLKAPDKVLTGVQVTYAFLEDRDFPQEHINNADKIREFLANYVDQSGSKPFEGSGGTVSATVAATGPISQVLAEVMRAEGGSVTFGASGGQEMIWTCFAKVERFS